MRALTLTGPPKWAWVLLYFAALLLAGLFFYSQVREVKVAQAATNLDVEKGTFTRTNGGAVNQTVNLVDTGMTPKVVIFWGTNQTTAEEFADAADEQSFHGYMVNATQQRSYASAQLEGNKNHKGRGAVKAIIIIDSAGAIDAEADFVSFNAGNFIINWTTNDNVENIIHYIAIGGSDLANAEVGDFNMNNTGADIEIDTVGAFTPKLVLFMGSRAITGYAANSTQDSFFWGMAKSSTKRGGMGGDMKGDKTRTTQRTDRVISVMSGGGILIGDADLKSMDSDATPGFTIQVTDPPVVLNKVAWLALGGANLNVELGSFSSLTANGIQTITTTNEMQLVAFQSFSKVASISPHTPLEPTKNWWGAATSTSAEGGTVLSLDDAKNNTNGTTLTKVIQHVLPGAVVTVDEEADFSAFNATDFKIDWTKTNATARETLYWAIGGTAAGFFIPPPPATSTATLGDSSLLGLGLPRTSTAVLARGVTLPGTSSATLSDTSQSATTFGRSSTATLGDSAALGFPLDRTSTATLTDSFLLGLPRSSTVTLGDT